MKHLLFPIPFALLLACQPAEKDANTSTPTADTTHTAPTPQPPVIDGPDEVRDDKGNVRMKGDMRHGRRNGVWTSFYANGQVQSRSDYTDGVLQGQTITLYPNGNPHYTGEYHNGKSFAEWKYYDEGGTLLKTVHYDSTGAVINDH